MGLKVGVCMLLIAWGIIAVQGEYKSPLVKRGSVCDWPDGTCYYYKDPCPEGTTDCGLSCTLGTNKCCCRNTRPTRPSVRPSCDWPRGTCYYYKDPCPKGWTDCDLSCTLPTNKCCCR